MDHSAISTAPVSDAGTMPQAIAGGHAQQLLGALDRVLQLGFAGLGAVGASHQRALEGFGGPSGALGAGTGGKKRPCGTHSRNELLQSSRFIPSRMIAPRWGGVARRRYRRGGPAASTQNSRKDAGTVRPVDALSQKSEKCQELPWLPFRPKMPRKPRKAPPALNLPLDKVSFIILKAREYDVKEEDSDPDEGSNPTDDGQTDVLTDKADDPVREELLGAIRGLNEDERIKLVALAWLGRGTYDIDEWKEAIATARIRTFAPHGGISAQLAAAGRLPGRRAGACSTKALSTMPTSPKAWMARMSRWAI